MRLHITKGDFDQTKQQLVNSVSNDTLRSLRQGRPQLGEIFKEIHNYTTKNQVNRVGIMTCGPGKMMDDVKNHCERMNGQDGVNYNYHYETFGFLDHLF